MDLKKAFDQTVRELKREVNKKVLKAPEIELKVLEATSNEAWGPHGTLMADIAQATRNYNDYQMIMTILWKRMNDTGKNWRHVYKALTVLEYLVANGAERVIDELREHAYQLQTLVDFQYIESSSGKDQGLNVRRKAQTLVTLINDTEKIREVRSKAAANREKYRGMSSTGGIYRTSSYSSTGGSYGGDRHERDDDRYGGGSRYGSRDDDRYGNSRDRDNDRYRDEDSYGRNGDRYGRDNDRFRDREDESDRDRDNDRSRHTDRNDSYASRDRGYDDDYRSGGKEEDDFRDERRSERTNGRSRGSNPPSYEEASGGNDSPYNRPDEPSGLAHAVARATTKVANQAKGPMSIGQPVMSKSAVEPSLTVSKSTEDFDDFDPRGNTATPSLPATVEKDLFSETTLQQPPATVPKSASGVELLFGEPSFNAAPAPTSAFVANIEPSTSVLQSSVVSASASVPPSFFTASAAIEFPNALTSVPPNSGSNSFSTAPDINLAAPINSNTSALPLNYTNSLHSSFDSVPQAPSTNSDQPGSALFGDSSFSALGSSTPMISGNNSALAPAVHPTPVGLPVNNLAVSQSQTSTGDGIAKPQQGKDKFEPKSSVWADHLSSGLLDLNIAKPKNNPLAELGIHLDSSRTTRKKEVTAAPPAKGKAMGSGTGMGIVGASILTPPVAPPVMGGGIGARPGFGMGMAPTGMAPGMGFGMGMGYGMNPGLGMAPQMGMNPGAGPGVGFGSNPAMMPGAGPGSMAMGMNPSFGPSYQQQQYGGFR